MSLLRIGVVGVYIAAMGALGYDLHANVAGGIEERLTGEVGTILPNGTRHGANVSVSGRDIEVTGLLHDLRERDALASALSNIDGQRDVRMGGVELLPVATPYVAKMEVRNGTTFLTTVLPDALAAARVKGALDQDVVLDYSLASGIPDAGWSDLLVRMTALSPHFETGSAVLQDRDLTLSGDATSRKAEKAMFALGNALPEGYRMNSEALTFPPRFAVKLTKPEGAPMSVSGLLPRQTDLVAFVSALRTEAGQQVTLGDDLTLSADGDQQEITQTLSRIGTFLRDLKTYELSMEQDGDLVLAGTAKPNVDLDAFDAKRRTLGFEQASIDIPKQYDVEFRLDARTGAELTGTAPEGFDADKLAENLGLPEIKQDNLDVGARGDSETLTDQISSLKPILQDVEVLTLGLAGEEGKEAPKAEVQAETLPNVDPARISALLGGLFNVVSEPEVSITTNTYENGQIRINGITGIKERYFDGYWMPIVAVTAASAENCRQVTDSILEKDRIEFASGKAELDPSARVVINRLAGVVGSCFDQTELDMELAGHTDNQGDANANMLLSILRVNSVRDALVARGIALARILTVGYGETRPIADNSTTEGRRKNRRTEFSWLE